MSVIVFGDSITNRASDDLGGWTSRLWNLMARDYFTTYAGGITDADQSLFELGIGGDTIRGVSKRFESELLTRIEITQHLPNEMIVGLAVGINDSRTNMSENIDEIAIDEFQSLYDGVVKRCKEIGVHVFCVGPTPVDETRTNPIFYEGNQNSYFNERVFVFNSAIEDIAINNGVAFVDVLSPFQKIIEAEGNDALLADGLHPNPRGHELIAENVYTVIKPML